MADSQHVFNVTAQQFEDLVLGRSFQTPVLVDFWADWCSPCKVLMPILAKLVEEYRGKLLLAKVNTEEQRELAAQFGIRSLPTVMLFKDGQPLDQFMGALPETDIRAFLDPYLPRDSDALLDRSQMLLQAGDADGALRTIEKAQADDPDNPRTQLAYARVLATLGKLAQARKAIDALPIGEQLNPDVVALRAQLLFDEVTQQAPAAAELEQRLATDPQDSEAMYQLAAHRVMDQDYPAALELLIGLMQRDRDYADDGARKGLLAVFDILGGQGELVSRYRGRMFNLLH
jgi:putative thioredoxin